MGCKIELLLQGNILTLNRQHGILRVTLIALPTASLPRPLHLNHGVAMYLSFTPLRLTNERADSKVWALCLSVPRMECHTYGVPTSLVTEKCCPEVALGSSCDSSY